VGALRIGLLSLLLLGMAATARAADPDPTTAETATIAGPQGVTKPAAPVPINLRAQNRWGEEPPDWPGRIRSGVGLFVMLGFAWLLSKDKKRIDWRLVAIGTGMQIVLGLFTLSPPGRWFFGAFNDVVLNLLDYTAAGSRFLFGNLATQNNLPVGPSVIPMPDGDPTAWSFGARMGPIAPPTDRPWQWVSVGSFFAFGVLPTIIFFSSLMAVTYHLGIMQRVVHALALIMQKTMRTSGAETLSAAGNIFLGQTEAPLLVRPFIATMTESELMAIMVGGFANVAGGVMAAYVGILSGVFPDIAGHLLTVSIMSAPASLLLAKMIIPEPDREKCVTYGRTKIDLPKTDANVIDAAARGAGEGLTLALNVGAMLLAFIALIAMLNGIIGWAGSLVGFEHLSLELILGWVLRPIAWIMGVAWADSQIVGSLLGVKTILNEFYAYLLLADQAPLLVSRRSLVICTYALCGFANFSSIAIQIGGLSPLAPERRGDLAKIGLLAMIGGTLATFMAACVIGMLT
jgi:concentrative nucleoside transporter, CNT family